jgi:hypothetical protein
MALADYTIVNNALVSIRERILQVILLIVAARHLGHGRRMEGYLIISKGLGFIILFLFPDSFKLSASLFDIFWAGYAHYVCIPFGIAFALSLHGLVGNILGWEHSRVVRFLGAFLGFSIWTWWAAKLIYTGDVATAGLFLTVPAAFYGEAGVMFLALVNRPEPGAPGNMGNALF